MNRIIQPLPAEDHACGDCGFAYATTSATDAAATVTALPDRIGTVVASATDPRRRPSPERWSVQEYVCHLRDVYVSSTIRLYRVRTEDEPRLEPMLNDLRAARFGYNELATDAVLTELRLCVGGFLQEVARVRSDGWDRSGTRLPGEARTARWLVRNAAHEGVHHAMDIDKDVGRVD